MAVVQPSEDHESVVVSQYKHVTPAEASVVSGISMVIAVVAFVTEMPTPSARCRSTPTTSLASSVDELKGLLENVDNRKLDELFVNWLIVDAEIKADTVRLLLDI